MTYEITVDGKPHRLELERAESVWKCRLDGREMVVDAVLARPDVLSLLIEGHSYEIKREQTATDLHLWVRRDHGYDVVLKAPERTDVEFSAGDFVTEGRGLFIPLLRPGEVRQIRASYPLTSAAWGYDFTKVGGGTAQLRVRSPSSGGIRAVRSGPGSWVEVTP